MRDETCPSSVALCILALTACLGACERISSSKCNARMDELEARLRDETAQTRQLGRITSQLREATRRMLPLVASAERRFDPGFAMWFDAALPDGDARFEQVLEALACEKSEGPIRIYAITREGGDTQLAERAAWAAKASSTWNRLIELRRVVRLEAEEDLFPWPPRSESAQRLAKEVFAVRGEQNVEPLKTAIRLVNGGCDAIGKHAAAEDVPSHERILGLPKGLRECGCSVINLDESIGVWHLLGMVTTEIRWQPAVASTTDRPVSPLACEQPRAVLPLRTTREWEAAPAEDIERAAIEQALQRLEDCRERQPLAKGLMMRVSVSAGLIEKTIKIRIHRDDSDSDEQLYCDDPDRLEVEVEVEGSTNVDVFVPAGKPPTVNRDNEGVP